MKDEFIYNFFYDTSSVSMKNLKEFTWNAFSLDWLKRFLDLYSNEFGQNITYNFPMLNRFEIHFQKNFNNVFLRNYKNNYVDCAKIKIKNCFYLHYRDKEKTISYMIKLKGESNIYASYIHHRHDDSLLSINFLYFMSLNPDVIEEIKSTENILTEKEINLLRMIIGKWYYRASQFKINFIRTYDHVQVNVPWENIISLNLNRYKYLTLDTWINTWSNTKLQNNCWEINLSTPATI